MFNLFKRPKKEDTTKTEYVRLPNGRIVKRDYDYEVSQKIEKLFWEAARKN